MLLCIAKLSLSTLQVPALPRGSLVEVQPLLLAPPGDPVGSLPQPLACSERVLPLNPAAEVTTN